MIAPRAQHHLEFNYAHDYIINDMLRHALGVSTIPAGGLDMPGAREKSAEEIVLDMRRNGQSHSSRSRVWDGEIVTVERCSPTQTGHLQEIPATCSTQSASRRCFLNENKDQATRTRAIKDLAAKGMAMAAAIGIMRGRGADAGSSQQNVRALARHLSHPWQVAVQRWLEGVNARGTDLHPRLTAWCGPHRHCDARPPASCHHAQRHPRHQRVDDR